MFNNINSRKLFLIIGLHPILNNTKLKHTCPPMNTSSLLMTAASPFAHSQPSYGRVSQTGGANRSCLVRQPPLLVQDFDANQIVLQQIRFQQEGVPLVEVTECDRPGGLAPEAVQYSRQSSLPVLKIGGFENREMRSRLSLKVGKAETDVIPGSFFGSCDFAI